MARAINYKNKQKKIQIDFFKKYYPDLKMKGELHYIIRDETSVNLYEGIRGIDSNGDNALSYFKENHISWWNGDEPSGNLLSSQIACLNHLMPLMKDKEAVLEILKGIDKDFTDVLRMNCDKHLSYISFEVVSDGSYLGEHQNKRGSNCTSIDAAIIGIKNGIPIIVAIEWKYTENYSNEDKSKGSAGVTRTRNYNHLIHDSAFLAKDPSGNDLTIYYTEPFYQLMRQTLWAEQMLKNRDIESLKAEDYLHIHVIPKANAQLLDKSYKASKLNMEDTWRGMLTDEGRDRYKIISPDELLKPLCNNKKFSIYSDLIEYLKERYWQ